MKKVWLLILVICMLTGCGNKSVGIIGGSDGPTAIFVTDSADNSTIESIRVINADGELYYDTGLASENGLRCGTMDGNLVKATEEFETPKNSGEANFDADGYQNATSITKEVCIDGKWIVFCKMDSYGDMLTRYKHVFKIKGTHPNAVKESEYIILANRMDISFDMITNYFFSSQFEDHMLDIKVVFPEISDKWGLLMYAEDVTDTSLKITFKQLGGYNAGQLQMGSWYEIERQADQGWEKLEYLPSEYERAWTSEAYLIPENEITAFEVNWEHLYGKLPAGTYRIGKKVTDFIKTGEYTEDIYYTMFTVEENEQ